MIRTFKNKQVKALYEGVSVRKWRAFRSQAERRLQILDSANRLQDLRNLPSNRFEALKGNRKGQYSIRINQQWRLCFTWENNEAYNADIVDYHH